MSTISQALTDELGDKSSICLRCTVTSESPPQEPAQCAGMATFKATETCVSGQSLASLFLQPLDTEFGIKSLRRHGHNAVESQEAFEQTK
jgi:hypothetical protein